MQSGQHLQNTGAFTTRDRHENSPCTPVSSQQATHSLLSSHPPPTAALVASDIMRAVNTLGPPNERDAMAVDARQEIDLRIGAAFTRLQTLLLQNKFDWSGLLPAGRERMLLSYGPCQFPTLGLIVQRLWWVAGLASARAGEGWGACVTPLPQIGRGTGRH